MNSGFGPKTVVLLFAAVLALYLILFYGIEQIRRRKGGWVVDFQGGPGGTPALVVSQGSLAVSNITLLFHGESLTNSSGQVRFDRVQRPLPFGRVIYEDLTFLPGVVTFDLFGHEIELVPRVLVADKREIPWQSGSTIDLWPTNKPATPPHPPKSRGR
jgi:hypothetical protein